MFARKMFAKNNRPGPVLSEDVSIHGIFVLVMQITYFVDVTVKIVV